ncbi:hypothetical protein M5362_15715 [Streptomyces sp. Je 1-79]|uniref:hypothetical protein n=1 Tax=Streptomyces sp. Je 1-79 TaxID=2943847 RepID=UPI0021A5B1CC|nr:hypothetical protein [Streptomyces sp. Je 1-79]MCT4354580.1 hypothetical protein [Streptomyces sp. Je 1-79]
MTLLDCTLRTTGQLTGATPSPQLVADYLAVCARLGIDVIELGRVQDPAAGGRPGDILPDGIAVAARAAWHGPRFAVLLDAAELPSVEADSTTAADRIADRIAGLPLPVGLVRLAVRYDQVARAAAPLGRLREAGFGVCLLLTEIDLASYPELDRCLDDTAALGPLDAVFLVDSLGSLRPERVIELVQSTRAAVAAPVGIHALDNQGFALHNTVVARSAGATWQDAAVHGIGPGAGMTRTEQLLALLGATPDDLGPLLELVATHFAPMKRRYAWGAGPRQVMAGLARIPVAAVRGYGAE